MSRETNLEIAYTLVTGRGQTDPLLAQVAESALKQRVKCIGCVQYNSMPENLRLCDMDVKVLPDGPMLRISETRGPEARGCRLDPNALETAVALTAEALGAKPDLLIVNKFGKHEASGRGFRPIIADALEKDIPVLVGVNALNEDAFSEFASGCAELLHADVNAVLTWVSTVTGKRADAA